MAERAAATDRHVESRYKRDCHRASVGNLARCSGHVSFAHANAEILTYNAASSFFVPTLPIVCSW